MRKSIIASFIIFIIIFYTSIFIVKEGEKGIVLRFGKVLRSYDRNPIIFSPGLHFRIPFLENFKILDSRIQTMENQADRFVTKEKKDLIVDSYIKWKISDFSRYYLATGGGDTFQAELLLKRKFSDRLRSEIGKLNVKDIVTDSRGKLTSEVMDSLNTGSSNVEEEISQQHTFLNESNELVSVNSNSMKALGIEVVDVRIKQINLPIEVSDAIYNRMRAEREAVARSQRSQGQEEAEKLRANSDYVVNKILAEAEKESLIIRGEGDAEAAKVFADSFEKDPEFYSFLRSLKTYKNSFQERNNIVILDTENDLLKYMKSPFIKK